MQNLFTLGLIFFIAPAAFAADKVKVTLYYESLCPDSIKFFNHQLYPQLQTNLSNYLTLQLVPFGKSTFTKDGQDFTFKCHHDQIECDGNKIHACALKKIENGLPTPDLGYNRKSVGFINCLLSKVVRDGANTLFPTKDCAELNNINNQVDIENCAHHVEGSQYLANYGTLTKELKPELKSVPTIVFNNRFKQEDNDLAQTNFVKALCQYITADKPEECNASTTAKLSFSALIVVLAVVFNSF